MISLYIQFIIGPSRAQIPLDSRTYFPKLEQIAHSSVVFYDFASVSISAPREIVIENITYKTTLPYFIRNPLIEHIHIYFHI